MGSDPPGSGPFSSFESESQLPRQVVPQLGVKEAGERFGQDAADLVVVPNVDLREDRLVHQPAQMRRGGPIRGLDVGQKTQREVEVALKSPNSTCSRAMIEAVCSRSRAMRPASSS